MLTIGQVAEADAVSFERPPGHRTEDVFGVQVGPILLDLPSHVRDRDDGVGIFGGFANVAYLACIGRIDLIVETVAVRIGEGFRELMTDTETD